MPHLGWYFCYGCKNLFPADVQRRFSFDILTTLKPVLAMGFFITFTP